MLKYIFINCIIFSSQLATSQTADFSFQSANGKFCTPSVISFTQNSTGSPVGFLWDFGNNTRAFGATASATYSTAGTYTVKLTTIYAQSTAEVSKTIVVNPAITASLGFDRNYICRPGVINFTGSSTGNSVKYTWDFGDSSGIINTNLTSTPHTYSAFGNYTVKFTATDTTGCTASASTTAQVIKPAITATVSPVSGCTPSNTGFSANVTVPAGDAVTSYTWNFGDGSPVANTAANNISHLYNGVVSYLATLNITTNQGCTNTFNFPAVAYGTPPLNHNAFPKKDTVCGSETPVFVARATNANYYYWDFGDGNAATVYDTITRHKYATLGTKTLTVTPYFNGCPGTPISFPIVVVGIIAEYVFSNTCTNRETYSFVNTSQGNLSSVLWTFGDNSPNVTTINATHTFPDSLQYNTSLKVTDAVTGCSDTYVQTIYAAKPVLINPDTSICRNSNTTFTILNTYTNPSVAYTWNVTGLQLGPTNTPSITATASILGNFNNFVSINYGPQSCPDTLLLNHAIVVRGPDLSFTAPASLCFNTLFSVNNTSKAFRPADTVKLWHWNYGNSTVNDTIYQPLPFKYGGPGSYNVKLTAIDKNGCIDSLIKTVTVNPVPFLLVVPRVDTLCQGQPATLRAFSSDSLRWSPANSISCVTCDSVVANPVATTRYFITATTPLNCSVTDSILVKVFSPFTATVPSNTIFLCLKDTLQLDASPKMKRITWSPGASLSNASIYNPFALPSQNTIYTASLTDSVGCFSSSVSVNVIIKSLPTVNAGPDQIVPYNSPFTISPAYSNNVTQYAWVPANSLSCNTCAVPTGTAIVANTYTIQVTSDSGCIAKDSITIFVECRYANILMPTAFTPNNDNLNDTYFPVTRGVKSIIKFAVYNRLGKQLYEVSNVPANSKTFAWKGEFKGQPQQPGAYVYVLEALCDVGQKITKSGSFLLLR